MGRVRILSYYLLLLLVIIYYYYQLLFIIIIISYYLLLLLLVIIIIIIIISYYLFRVKRANEKLSKCSIKTREHLSHGATENLTLTASACNKEPWEMMLM